MSWTNPRTWVALAQLTAAQLNAHLRDNLLETEVAKVTTKGDIAVATGANALARVGVGSDGSMLQGWAAATTGTRFQNPVYHYVDTTVGPDGDSTETTLFSKQIAANDLGAHGRLLFTMYGLLHKDNSASSRTYTLRIKFGGSTIATLTHASTAALWTPLYECRAYLNNTATNAQRLYVHMKSETSLSDTWESYDYQTAIIDTTSAQTFEVTAQIPAVSAVRFLMYGGWLQYFP